MEKVYPRVPKTDIAEVYLREIGPRPRGLFPLGHRPHLLGGPGVDHGKLLRNAVDGQRTRSRPVPVTGPGVLDVTVWRQKDSITVHLVNLTNPMMMKGPFRELIPIGEQQVVVRLPEGLKARKVHLLVADRDLPITQNGNRLTVAVPAIRDHEVVAIDF